LDRQLTARLSAPQALAAWLSALSQARADRTLLLHLDSHLLARDALAAHMCARLAGARRREAARLALHSWWWAAQMRRQQARGLRRALLAAARHQLRRPFAAWRRLRHSSAKQLAAQVRPAPPVCRR